jgi:hypothetical protein
MLREACVRSAILSPFHLEATANDTSPKLLGVFSSLFVAVRMLGPSPPFSWCRPGERSCANTTADCAAHRRRVSRRNSCFLFQAPMSLDVLGMEDASYASQFLPSLE